MNLSLDDAVFIFAKANRARFGIGAARKTEEQIHELADVGDSEGVEVFERVKSAVHELDRGRDAAERERALS
jgi:hypothetical protein